MDRLSLRRVLFLPAVLAMLVIGTAAFSQPVRPETIPKVVARINGKEVTRDQLAQLAVNMYGPQVYERLIQQELVRQEAGKQAVTVSREEIEAFTRERVDEQIAQLAKQLGLKESDDYEAQLKKIGTSVQQLRESARKRLEPHVWYELVSRKLVRRTIEVADAEVRAEFDRKYGPKVQVRQVVLPTRGEAEAVLKKLTMGAEFAKLAKERSIDNLTRHSGGELPPVPAASEIGKAVADLKPGGVSRVTEIATRFHVFQLIERIEPRKADFNKLASDLRKELVERRVRERGRIWLQALMNKAKIERYVYRVR